MIKKYTLHPTKNKASNGAIVYEFQPFYKEARYCARSIGTDFFYIVTYSSAGNCMNSPYTIDMNKEVNMGECTLLDS